jgi:hypothetical protein
MTAVETLRETLVRWQRGAMLLAAGGVAGCIALGLADEERALKSYLSDFLFWWMVTMGCLGILMLYYLVGGRWGEAARPVLECGAATIALVAIAFLPIALGIGHIYPWAPRSPGENTARAASASQSTTAEGPRARAHVAGYEMPSARAYLSPPFFHARAAGYFVLWMALAFVLRHRARSPIGPRRPRRLQLTSAGGLVALLLSGTFASIDWAMSLTPGWYSTMYGALVMIGAGLAGFALVTLTAALVALRSPPGASRYTPDVLADLATLMLAFLMLWAYFAFSQFLIIWSGNLPEENRFYVTRFQDGWQWMAVAVLVFQFAVPFLLLLSRDLKENPRSLAAIAALVFVMQFVFVLWTIVPAFDARQQALGPFQLAMAVAQAGVWLSLYLGLLRGRVPALLGSD